MVVVLAVVVSPGVNPVVIVNVVVVVLVAASAVGLNPVVVVGAVVRHSNLIAGFRLRGKTDSTDSTGKSS